MSQQEGYQILLVPEIVLHYLSFLDVRTLSKFMTVSREWHELINHKPILWDLLIDQYSERLIANPRQVFHHFMKIKQTTEMTNMLYSFTESVDPYNTSSTEFSIKFEETIRKDGLLNNEELLKSLKLDDNNSKHKFGLLVGRIYAHCWQAILQILKSKPFRTELDKFVSCAKRIRNFKFYEIIRMLGLTEKCCQVFECINDSSLHKELEILKPLFSLSYFCQIAASPLRSYDKKGQDQIQMKKIEALEKLLVTYFKNGNNIVIPENLLENNSFQEMVYNCFDDMIRLKIIRQMFGSKWPCGESETSILFSAFFNKLNSNFLEKKVEPSALGKTIDQCIEILKIEKCDHEPFIQLIQGRWYGQVVDLFKKYKYLIDARHVKRLFQSAFIATDYTELIKYLICEYDINPLEFYDERNIIAQYFERLIENQDYSLRFVLDPLLNGKKLDLVEFCAKCQENNYPNLSSVERIFNIMELLAKDCPSYAFVALISSLNYLFEPQIIFSHSIIFERLLEFYNEEKTQLNAYEELLYNTQVVSDYSNVKYQSLKEMMSREGEKNQLFGEVLELCEKHINEKKSEQK